MLHAAKQLTCAVATLLLFVASPGFAQDARLLFKSDASDLRPTTPTNAKAGIEGATLTLEATGQGDASIVLPAPDAAWDLSAHGSVVMTVRNDSDAPLALRARLENESAAGMVDTCRGVVLLLPGQSDSLRVRIMPTPQDPGYEPFKPFFMYTKGLNVRENTIDPKAVARLVLSIDQPRAGQKITIAEIRAEGAPRPIGAPFVPFIDEFGQYIHSDWPGKVHSVEDFKIRREEETRERQDWPGPADWDEYGGWSNGPKRNATGYFHVAKHDGKWWMVNPIGNLFWSYGPTGVGFGGDLTPITDREHWFSTLPDRTRWSEAYRARRGATYMYYKDREWEGYDVALVNLQHKYGPDFRTIIPRLSHERLRSWGFNTVANWSSPDVYLLKRTPYTVAIHYDAKLIHYRMPDVYHPDWEKSVREAMERQRGRTNEDPWNIGYFVDNERWWGWRPRAAAIGEATLNNDADCHAKIRFVEMLKEKYATIDKLNEGWGTRHESWDALLALKQAPDMKNEKTVADCGDFGMVFAERYFSKVRDIVKSVAPNIMYMGPRFHGHIDPQVVQLASRYCDLISYNIYDNPPDGRVNQYRSLDVPILSTEWGIGSDPLQTPFRGDRPLTEPKERIDQMTRYAERAIRHPSLVGAHFFQYRDQPISGRPDGEAVLRGFVNITDTPNFDLVHANRRVAYNLYQLRSEAK